MKRFVMRHVGWRAAAVSLLAFALCLTIATPGCGKKESTPSSKGGSLQAGEEPSAAADSVAETDRGEPVVPIGRDVSVNVVPSSPSRIEPASVSVKSRPGRDVEIAAIRWVVNGVKAGEGRLLSPSLFGRGDRIQAVVTLRTGGEEKILTSPEVKAVNALPAVEKAQIDPQAPTAGSEVRAVVTARDPDGDPLTFKHKWYVNNNLVPGEDATLNLSGVRKGSTVHVVVTPNDGFADGAWKYSPIYEVVNASPVVTSKAPTTISPSRVLTHTIVAEDPDGDPLTYTLDKGTEGMTLSGPTLTWQVSDEDIGRPAEIVIRISDNQGGETVLTMTLTPQKQ